MYVAQDAVQLQLYDDDMAKILTAAVLKHMGRSDYGRAMLEVIYRHVNPSKLPSIDHLLERRSSNVNDLIRRVASKYGIDLVKSFPMIDFDTG